MNAHDDAYGGSENLLRPPLCLLCTNTYLLPCNQSMHSVQSSIDLRLNAEVLVLFHFISFSSTRLEPG